MFGGWTVDRRILNQFALFSLMSSPTARLDDWLEEHPELVRRLTLPARLKWEVRDKLDQSNVNERVLFPGLDGLSRWLARYYMRRLDPVIEDRAGRRPPIHGRRGGSMAVRARRSKTLRS